MNTTAERTLGEARLDLGYAICISHLCEKFNGRMHKACQLVSLAGGSGAAVLAFQGTPGWTAALGVLVMLATLLDITYDYRGQAAAHRAQAQAYLALKQRNHDELGKLDAALCRLQQDSIPVVEGLKKPAYNRNLMSNGLTESMTPLNRWERLLDALV